MGVGVRERQRYHARMKITDVRTRTFVLPLEDHHFHPTWQPAASREHRVHGRVELDLPVVGIAGAEPDSRTLFRFTRYERWILRKRQDG